jgi:hypothetical protein
MENSVVGMLPPDRKISLVDGSVGRWADQVYKKASFFGGPYYRFAALTSLQNPRAGL